MTGKYGLYHKKCFKCFKCKRPLDYNSLTEGPDSEVYCKNCYAVEHGHKSKWVLLTSTLGRYKNQGRVKKSGKFHYRGRGSAGVIFHFSFFGSK